MHRKKAGQLKEARRSIQMGNDLARQGKTDQAVAHFERALSLWPDSAETHNNLGNVLAMLGKIDQAVAHFERALSLRPDYGEAHYNLGLALAMQGKADEAASHYERAQSFHPEDAVTHNNMALNLAMLGNTTRAISHLERALSLRENYAEAHNNLGNALMLQGKTDEAATHYKRALSLQPDFSDAHSNLLFAINYTSSMDPATIYAAHLDFARQHESPLVASIPAHSNDRTMERRIRIGYVSSDFRQHSVAHFIEPVLEHHDRDRFDIYCYSSYHLQDDVTERLQAHAGQWRDISRLSDDLAANQIRADRIDILIDLSGHTARNRLLVFARIPAPVQVTWLGYPNTTGLSAMDYRITDGYADPVGWTERFHSEQLVRLPECFSCYRPPRDAPEISGLSAQKKGYITFGSFNNPTKITPEVIAVWAGILRAVSGSHLILKNSAFGEKAMQQRVRGVFAGLGIAPKRLDLWGNDGSQKSHLERYLHIDIGLDPFPYNGTTTTCDALWMGVPVVTLAGKTHAGRVGVSQMSNLGLTELIGNTHEEYIAMASRLAADLGHLETLRQELRARMAASPLMNAPRFTKNLEQAYLAMWNDWCQKTSDRKGVVIE